MSTLNFNVSGDPGSDIPVLVADNPPGGTTLATHFEGVQGETPNRFVAEVPPEISGGATVRYQNNARDFRVIVPPGEGSWEAGLPPCLPPEYNGDVEKVVLRYAAESHHRSGVVRLVGRAWVDDDGPFYPLYSTMLYAFGAWTRGDAAHVRRDWQLLASHAYDGYRALAQVNWPGEAFDIRSHPAAFAEMLDAGFNEFGLRCKITLVGGGAANPEQLARAVYDVVKDRRHTVLMLEGVNEGNASPADAVAIARILIPLGIPVAVGLGDQGIATLTAAGAEANSSVDIIHTERGAPAARQIRQGWDFNALRRASDDGEPVGPHSSGVSQDDPLTLAMMRLAAIISGAGSFCLHTGEGVYGHPNRDRGAEIADAPRIMETLPLVRSIDAEIPRGIENWTKYNTGLPVEIATGDCDKIYGCRSGRGFVQIVSTCLPGTTLRAVAEGTTYREIVYGDGLHRLVIGQTR